MTRDAADRLAPVVLGGLLGVPSLIAYYLPMSDLPLHEAMVGVMHGFYDPTFVPPGLYEWNLGHPNQLFHVTAWLLSFVVSTRWAVKIVVAGAQLLLFVAGARLADHMGRSRWGVLLLTPLALGFTYFWGLVANLLGLAALLFALPAIDRYAERPTRRGFGVAVLTFAALYFAHESVYVMGCGALLCLSLVYARSLLGFFTSTAPIAVAAVWALLDLRWQSHIVSHVTAPPPAGFLPLRQKLASIPSVLFGSYEELPLYMLFGIACACALALVARRWMTRSAPPESEPGGRLERARAFALRFRFELLAAGLFVTYLIAPFNWKGATMLHERFLGPAWALFAVCAAPRGKPWPLSKLALAVFPISVLLVSWPQFIDSDQTARDLDALLAQIPRGSSVTLVVLDPPMAHMRMYYATDQAARALAVVGGRSGLTPTGSPIAAIQVRRDLRWDEYDRRTFVFGSVGMIPPYDLEKFGWVVAQSRDAIVRGRLRRALYPDATFVSERGEWMLLQSTHEIVSPLSPEGPPPPAGAQTLLDRVNAVIRHDAARARAAQAAEGSP